MSLLQPYSYTQRILCILVIILCEIVFSSVSEAKSFDTREALKKEFLLRIGKQYEAADRFMEDQGISDPKIKLRGLPDGEFLIFDLTIPPSLLVDGTVFAEIYKQNVVLSLNDFIQTLQFPIVFDDETQTYTGWFIREDKTFFLDVAKGLVNVNGNEYKLGEASLIRDGDVYAPVESLVSWFQMKMDVDIGTQRIVLSPEYPLPATARYARRQKNYKRRKTEPPKLPRYDDEYELVALPVVDVSTRSSYKKKVDSEATRNHSVNIRTAGEFAKGALSTNFSLNNADQLASARFNYLQESSDAEILGPAKARRFEAGDITPTRLPLTGSSSQEIGARITNRDPLNNIIMPSTQIAGYFYPEWDVELYRDSALLGFQQADDEGHYNFDNIPLLPDRNVFRVVAYGPQGEVREQSLNVPYDRNRLAESGGVYDISLTVQNRKIYEKTTPTDQDVNTPHIVGFYEFPLSGSSALRVGGRYRQEEGTEKFYSNAALSATYLQTLINADVAADELGEFAASLSAAREFGTHRARTDMAFSTKDYNPGGQEDMVAEVFSNSYYFDGPFPFLMGDSPRYSASFGYDVNAENEATFDSTLRYNTQFKRVGYSQAFNYSHTNTSDQSQKLDVTTAITGSFGRDMVRVLSHHNLKPKTQIDSLSAFWKRKYSDVLESQFKVNRSLDSNLTRYTGQLNWRPKYAAITPRLVYNSVGDIEATVNVHFSLAKVPQDSNVLITNKPLTSSGRLSAFVFLDKNGDDVFNGDDEPLEGIKVRAPHNSGGGVTNDNGVAYVSQLRPNLLTDVFVEEATLPDPFWISGSDGVSVMPRTGDNISLEFPIHISGEVEGTAYKELLNGEREPLSRAVISLFDMQGKEQVSMATGGDGYYILSLIPPGDYFLMVDMQNLPSGFGRPLPRKVTIGYDGTMLYEQDVIVKEGQADVEISLLSSSFPDCLESSSEVFLNLGAFNSNLMMAYVWKELVDQHSYVLGGTQLLEKPKDSQPDPRNGKHVLRAKIAENSFIAGYKRCQALVSSGDACVVEVVASSL